MRPTIREALLLALLGAAAVSGCGDAPVAEEPRAEAPAAATAAAPLGDLETVTLTVPDMTCRLCANTIERTLGKAGLREVAIDLEEKRVAAKFDPARITPEAVGKLVTDLGYTVSAVEVG